jgi:CRP-like cAMP-binding protein
VPSQPAQGKLSPDFLWALRGLSPPLWFPEGAVLFQEGIAATGVYVVVSGEVRVLLPTNQRQQQLLELAGPGSILGLSETLTAEEYRSTGVAADKTMAIFIPHEQFLELLGQRGDLCMQVVRLLSEDLHGLYHKFRSISAHPGRPRQRDLDEQLN